MDFICGGYFLTKRGPRGKRNGRNATAEAVTLSPDQTDFFPSTMVLEWAREKKYQPQWADSLGIPHELLPALIEKGTAMFDRGVWFWPNVIPSVDTARELLTLIPASADWLLLGFAVAAETVDELIQRNAPPPQARGYAPNGSGGVYLVLREKKPLAPGCTVLGFDILNISDGQLQTASLDVFDGPLNSDRLFSDFASAQQAAKVLSDNPRVSKPTQRFTAAMIVSYPLQTG